MTLRLSRVSVALLCFLLAVATSTSAEGAWITWWGRLPAIAKEGPLSEAWMMGSAFPSYQLCQQSKREFLEFMKNTPSGKEGAFYAECYPDTVDPRRPKGK